MTIGSERSDALFRVELPVGDDGLLPPSDYVAGAGTSVGFEQFYAGEFDAMVRVAFFLVGSQESAEELVQDAFVRLYRRWAELENPGGYLRATVVNGCRDRLRRRRRLDRHQVVLGSNGSGTAPWGADQSADRAVLMAALARLPIRCRTALVLRFYGGYSERETAEAMGVAVGTVKSFVHRGLKQLRQEIES